MQVDHRLLRSTAARAMRFDGLPVSLRFVALLFLTIGAVGVALTAFHALRGQLTLNAGVVGLPIGYGLVRLKPGWHTCAVGAALLAIVLALLVFVSSIAGFGDFVTSQVPVRWRPYFFAFVCLGVVLTFVMVWSLRILTDPQIRTLFARSRTDRIASSIRAVLFALAVLFASRLSGGLEGTLAFTWSFSRAGPRHIYGRELGDLGVAQPLVVKVQADDEPSYFVFIWDRGRELNQWGGTTVHNEFYNWRFTGLLVPDWVRNSADKIIVDIEEPILRGPYWFPFIKRAHASVMANLTGSGRYRSFSGFCACVENFNRVGLSTPADVRRYVRVQLAERTACEIVQSSAMSGKGLAYLEQLAREYRLDIRETQDLASAYGRLGNEYHRAGRHADAMEVYQRNILALEMLVSWAPRGWKEELIDKLANTYNHVAWQLATDPRPEARDGFRAVDYAEKACQITDWKRGECLDALAAASAEVGNFEKAVQWQEMALSLIAVEPISTSKTSTAERRVDAAELRLALYRSGVACRERRPGIAGGPSVGSDGGRPAGP